MEKKEIAQKVNALLANDRLEDACELIANSFSEFSKDVIVIQGEISSLEKEFIHNTIDQKEKHRFRNQIRSRIALIATRIKKLEERSYLVNEATDSIEKLEEIPGIQEVKEAVELLDYWRSAGELLEELRGNDEKGQLPPEYIVVETVCEGRSAKIKSEKEEFSQIFKEFLDFIQSRLLTGDDIDDETFYKIHEKIRPSRRKLFVLFFEGFQKVIQQSLETNLPQKSLDEILDIFRIMREHIDP